MSLRLAFLGTPDFALPTLAALLDAGHDIAAVYCRPPRPAGRGQAPRPSPVESFARARGLGVRTPVSLRGAGEIADFAALGLDAAAVVAYGLILPPAMLEAPRLGCINVHASLLPRWRGAAPIHRALLAGDAETGITIMRMDAGLDTGPMLAVARETILARDTVGSLHERLARLGARLLVATLDDLAAGRVRPVPQPGEGVCYAAKIDKREGEIDWREDAVAIDRRVRALTPFPGAFSRFGEERLRLLGGEVVETEGRHGAPGTVLDDRLAVACGSGVWRAVRLQRPGRKAMTAGELLRGFPIPAGSRLGEVSAI